METTKTNTPADPAAAFRQLDEVVIRLREWGTDRLYMLPQPASGVITGTAQDAVLIGASERCKLQLVDSSNRVSREHARLSWEGRWVLRDLGSKNGLWVDGERRVVLPIDPGVELGIGGLTLVAETQSLIELRCFLSRILGWAEDRKIIDLALRAIRAARARRAVLTLVSDDEMVSVARSIHRWAQGDSRPFIMCDPGRQPGDESPNAPASRRLAVEALAAATSGTIVLRADRVPRDIGALIEALRDPAIPVQVIVCTDRADQRAGLPLAISPLVVPPLKERSAEVPHIIREYCRDAAASFATKSRLSKEDRAWVAANSASSLSEIERGTRRLLAIRISRSHNAAAGLLGISHSSLFEWMQKRRLLGT